MTLEVIVIIAVVVIFAGTFLFFALAKRAIRLAIRLVLVFALILVVVVAGLLISWYGRSNSKPAPQQNRPANARRANSR